MPPVCLYTLQDDFLTVDENTSSYEWIMYTLWAMHVIHFAFELRIYEIEKKDKRPDK